MRRWLLAAVFCLMSLGATGAAWAQCVAYPFNLTNGTIADANQVMANFNAVQTCAQSGAFLQAANNTAMAALLTTNVSNGVVNRLGFAAKGDAPAQVYLAENGTCAANSRINDGGSCVNTTSGDGNSFYAVFPSSGRDVRVYGAIVGGGDATAAIQACLTSAVGTAVNTCLANGRFTVAGNLSIPVSTTLQCQPQPTFVEGQGASGNKWNTVPALLLSSTAKISASGDGAALSNCNVLNASLSFPLGTTARASYGAGVAFADAGFANVHLTGSRIVGWDTAALMSGPLPVVDDIVYDGNGANNQCGAPSCAGAYIVTTGNTDFGFHTRIRSAIGYFFDTTTNFPTNFCAELPGGNGFYVGGTVDHTAGVFMDNVLVEGYKGTNFFFANSAWAGKIWSDNFSLAPWSCSLPSAVGINVAAGTELTAQTVNISQGATGMIASGDLMHVDEMQIGGQSGDGVKISGAGKRLIVDKLFFSGPTGFCINQTAVAASIVVGNLEVTSGCNGNAFPYFANTSGVNTAVGRTGNYWTIRNLILNNVVPFTGDPFDSHILGGPGSETVLTSMQPVLTGCTGLGVGGTCSFDGNSDVVSGAIVLQTGSSGTAAAGNVAMTLPITALNSRSCSYTLSGGWNSASTVIANGSTQLNWATNAGVLPTGTSFPIFYNCTYY